MKPRSDALAVGSQIQTDIPARLDRLPWSGWHWRVVIALGVTWILDGLEVTVVGAVAGVLGETDTLHLSETEVGLSLMIAQAFAYNAIFFTYALVLARFYSVPADSVGLYLLPFAAGNLLGPLLLGGLFDSIGRRVMITVTYGTAGLLLMLTGWCFAQGWLTAVTQTVLWSVVFFIASAAASSAYLTVSELFPVELRGMAIALFYAVGTAAGGLVAPGLFGAMIQSGSKTQVLIGYLTGGLLMMAAAVVAAFLGVAAEGRSLEALAEPGPLPDRAGPP